MITFQETKNIRKKITYNQKNNKAKEKIDFSIHNLKQSFNTYLLEIRVDLRQIQEKSGHDNFKTAKFTPIHLILTLPEL